MKLATYENYKPSGVLWLGQVPDHWDVWKVAHGFQQTGSGTTPPSDNQEWYDGDICWVTTSELREQFIFDTEKKISCEALESFSALKVFPKGSLAVAMYGATIGRLGIFGVEAATNQACCVLYGEKAFDTRFTFYWLQVFREQIILLASGGGQPNISQEKVRSIRIACPPIEKQQTIARFLDAKTAQIDTLVAKKRQLIDKLKEKRSALIARTVTRGLPPEAAEAAGLAPNPEMKDSGLGWIGEMPAHWGIDKFSREIFIAEGQVDPEVEPYASMLLIAPNHIESGTGRLLAYESAADQSAESGKYYCVAGSVIYSKIRPALRKVVIAPVACLCSADMYPLNCRKKLTNKYLYWLLLSDQFSAWSVLESDRVAMPKINRDTLNELRLPIPPIDEQVAIVTYLEVEATKLDKLIAKVEIALGRLTEYRQALITSAVTGKIDVRNHEHMGATSHAPVALS